MRAQLPAALVLALGVSHGCFYDWDVLPSGNGGAPAGGAGGLSSGGGGQGGDQGGGGSGGDACPGCPVVLADDQASPRAIAVADGYVYWASTDAGMGDDSLFRVPVGGGPIEALASGVRSPFAIALDDDFVYATEYEPDGRLVRVPRSGGTPTTLDTPGEQLIGVAVDDGVVYYSAVAGTLRKMTLPAGTPEVLGSTGATSNLIVVAGGYVYGTRLVAGGGVWRVPIEGGATDVIAPEVGGTAGIATDGGVVVYTVIDPLAPRSGAVRSMGLGGQNLFTLAAGQAQPAEVALFDTRVYWANTYDGTIHRGGFGAGTPEMLATDQASPNGIVVDDQNVYWTNTVPGGEVMRLSLAGIRD